MDMISGYKAATEVCFQNKWDLLLQLWVASPIQSINDGRWQCSENWFLQSHTLLRKINYLKEFLLGTTFKINELIS